MLNLVGKEEQMYNSWNYGHDGDEGPSYSQNYQEEHDGHDGEQEEPSYAQNYQQSYDGPSYEQNYQQSYDGPSYDQNQQSYDGPSYSQTYQEEHDGHDGEEEEPSFEQNYQQSYDGHNGEEEEPSYQQTYQQAYDASFNHIFAQVHNSMANVLASGPTKRMYIERDREDGHTRLWNDYFSDHPIYPPAIFRRRFRMKKPLFLRIVDRLCNEVHYFQQRKNGHGRYGLTGLQKCTAALRVLAYGQAADTPDEYLRLGESTTRKSLEYFVDAIIEKFGEEYLRKPTPADIQHLLDVGQSLGFPGMIGSIDCMHWEWKNCPTAWRGMYARGSGKPTIVLEAVASHDLWIWHAFFGPPGTMNDINILDRSPVFNDILYGRAPKVSFKVNGHRYKMPYYLTDGIYPNWTTFIQSITLPQTPKAKKFAEKQEGVRKAVERAFGVLQARFAIIRKPALQWDKDKVGKIMTACIILHNMIVEDEREGYSYQPDTTEFETGESSRSAEVGPPDDLAFDPNVHMVAARRQMHDKDKHAQLKADLVEHVWQKYGNE